MPKKLVHELSDQLNKMHDELLVLKNDMNWIKKLLIAAASLGFIEKAIGWFIH